MGALPKAVKRIEQSSELTDRVIRMAWHDRTPFELIEARTGLSEAEVIRLMRRQLKRGSFKVWRARVSSRVTKHRKLFERRHD